MAVVFDVDVDHRHRHRRRRRRRHLFKNRTARRFFRPLARCQCSGLAAPRGGRRSFGANASPAMSLFCCDEQLRFRAELMRHRDDSLYIQAAKLESSLFISRFSRPTPEALHHGCHSCCWLLARSLGPSVRPSRHASDVSSFFTVWEIEWKIFDSHK